MIKPYEEKLSALLNGMLPAVVEFVMKRCREYVKTVENNLVQSTLNVISTFWTHFIPVDGAYEGARRKLALEA